MVIHFKSTFGGFAIDCKAILDGASPSLKVRSIAARLVRGGHVVNLYSFEQTPAGPVRAFDRLAAEALSHARSDAITATTVQ